MQCSGPLRRNGIVGQGGEEDGPQRAPCAGGRAAGRRNGGLRTAKGRRGGLGGAAFRRAAVHGLCNIQANLPCGDYRM